MIRSMKVSGLGPHERHEFEFDGGWTSISGPSMSGKTTLLHALAFCWWGQDAGGRKMPVELIREDAPRADVEITFASGTMLRRTMTKRRSTSLWHNTAKTIAGDWDDTLGDLSERHMARPIVFPLAWTSLAKGPGGGRPLRDLLIDAAGLSLDEILDEQLVDGEPRDERSAMAARTAARREMDMAEGALAEAAAVLEVAKAAQPDMNVSQAEQIVADATAWADYLRVLHAHEESVERRAKAEDALEGWAAERKALGERPEPSTDHTETLAVARAARDKAAETLREAEAAERAAGDALARCKVPVLGRPDVEDAALQEARRLYATANSRLKAMSAGKVCPTCKRDGWGGAGAARDELIADVDRLRNAGDAAKKAHDDAAKALEAEHKEANKRHRTEVASLKKAATRASARAEECREALARAREAADTAADLSSDPAAAWDARSRALGAKPKVPDVLPCPTEPGCPEVESSMLDEARRVLDHRDRDREAVTRATERRAAAEAAAEAARKKAGRADAVVEWIRAAPNTLISQAVEELGDMGPVTVEPQDGGGIEVLIDGLPWWTASRGRLIVADLQFRAALRDVAEFDWLPIVVDNAQDWSSEWPSVDGPVWLLTTEDTDEITTEVEP